MKIRNIFISVYSMVAVGVCAQMLELPCVQDESISEPALWTCWVLAVSSVSWLHSASRGSSPSARRRKHAADSVQVVWRRSSRRSDPRIRPLSGPAWLRLCVLCYSPGTPRFSLQALRVHTGICQTVASPRLPRRERGLGCRSRLLAGGLRLCCSGPASPGSDAFPLPGGSPG